MLYDLLDFCGVFSLHANLMLKEEPEESIGWIAPEIVRSGNT